MHLEVELVATNEDSVALPIHYNSLLQGLIYSMLKLELPALHDKGYAAGARTFRLFVFSRLFGRVKEIMDGKIVFASPLRFKVGSPLKDFIEVLGENMLAAGEVRLGEVLFWPASVTVLPLPDFSSGQATGRAISPVTVYSTLQTSEGKKKTYFYHPAEKEFREQVKNNLLKKAAVLGIALPPEASFSISAAGVKSSDLKVIYYKNTVIKGWLGTYRLEGDPALIALAFNAGIGAKNPQGLGMLEPVI